MSELSKKIFVRGMSRSGGTLVVTILDAHTEIAMSYEIYESLLDPNGNEAIEPNNILRVIEKEGLKRELSEIEKLDHRGIKIFISRLERGGLDAKDLIYVLKQQISENKRFITHSERLDFIERCALIKMKRENKTLWGMKCTNRIEGYLAKWPDAFFINIIRDGRDVLASQIKIGSFNKTPKEVAKGWVRTHTKFRRISNDPSTNTYELFYEKLVNNPENQIAKLCGFLEIKFEPSMINFYKKDLTIFHASHISKQRISSPIDTSQIGRWKIDLNDSQLEEFNVEAYETMKEFGYL